MKIVIIGAGEVGYNIASRLSLESKDVVVIDQDVRATRRISEDLDVQVVTGSGSNPETLRDAGLVDADMLLAVTDSDEINIVACLVANQMSPLTRKLIRLRNEEFIPFHPSLKKEAPRIDTIINPEAEVVKTIRKLMTIPNARDKGEFVNGKVKYVGIRLDKTSPIAGMEFSRFYDEFGTQRPLIAAIVRENEVIVPRGKDKPQAGDLVYFVCDAQKLESTLSLLGISISPVRKVLIIGGGRIGSKLAKSLEKDNIQVKIIESDLDRCNELSMQTEKAVILHGDGSDQKLFMEENIGQMDAVVSVTNDDETNILVSLLAKNMGVINTITRIGKSSYYPLLSTIGIEKVVSTRVSAVSSILQDIRQGNVISDISIFGERGEFIEAIALETSEITKAPLKDISFPKGALLVCITRKEEIIIPTGDSHVQPGDRIILFAVQGAVKKLEKMLTVKLGFF
ncbi:MAG: Trk system potassium transporter TrkA [Desulfobacterales bacterium]|nr:Trk system potassium transporter TrkA [Desulfobacterales bacterium]